MLCDTALLLSILKLITLLFDSTSTRTTLNPCLSPFHSSSEGGTHLKLRTVELAARSVTRLGAAVGAVGKKLKLADKPISFNG